MRQNKTAFSRKERSIHYALDLIEKYQPRDPVELANLLGLRVVIRDLPSGIYGLVAELWGVTIVLISNSLPQPEQNYIAAHEIFHSLDEHPPELLVKKGYWGELFETQADYFACGLMIKELPQEDESLFEYAARTGVPLRLVRLWYNSNLPDKPPNLTHTPGG